MSTKKDTGEKFDIYAMVTERMVKLLEQGIVPWQKPWKGSTTGRGNGPRNYISNREYSGVNAWLLHGESLARGLKEPYWVTRKQCYERGGFVQGEGTVITFWMVNRYKDKKTGEEKKGFVLRYFRVWNIQDTTGMCPIAQRHPEATEDGTEDAPEPIAEGERISGTYLEREKLAVRDGGDRAYYSPSADYIGMPLAKDFHSMQGYYATLFHEMAHSTGHDKRLKRTFGLNFGSELYSKEELVAEMTSAFLMAESGMETEEVITNSAAYLQSWTAKLREEPKMLVYAAAAATKAARFILTGKVEAPKEAEPTPEEEKTLATL